MSASTQHGDRSPARGRCFALCALGMVACGVVFAGGPWRVRGDGTPMAWTDGTPGPGPVNFRIDGGTLGLLENLPARTHFQLALDQWDAVGVIDLEIDPVPLAMDVNAVDYADSNADHYLNFWDEETGTRGVKVIFDTDGSIVEDMLGQGAGDDVLGLARIDTRVDSSQQILEASIILNGRAFDGVPPDLVGVLQLRALMVHEIGHALNLGHSIVNHELAGDGDVHNDRYIPTMFPFLTEDETALSVLNPDDIAALIGLYGSSSNKIEGQVTFQMLPVQGIHVIARRTDDPLMEAYSAFSGARFFPNTPPGGVPTYLKGHFEIAGLTSGDYQVCVRQPDVTLTDVSGTQIGPLATPPLMSGPEECYDDNEAAPPAMDDPDARDDVTVPDLAVHILLNAEPADDPIEGTGSGTNDVPANATMMSTGLDWTRDSTYGTLAPGDVDFYSIFVLPGARLRVDIESDELGYGLDPVIFLYDGNNLPVQGQGEDVVVDDALDLNSGQVSLDPWLTWMIDDDFVGPAKIGVSCYPDTVGGGCSGGTNLAYWIRVEVDFDLDDDGIIDRNDVCILDRFNDTDRDDLCVVDGDGCPTIDPNPGPTDDDDSDGIFDVCDNCTGCGTPADCENADQLDVDTDGSGDACDSCTDTDGDGYGNPGYAANTCPDDNCPTAPNPAADCDSDGMPPYEQCDDDSDGSGDACDPCPGDPTNLCVDLDGPEVQTSIPTDGQVDLGTSSDLLLWLDQAAASGTVDERSVVVELLPSRTKIGGTVSLSDDTVISFDPETALQEDQDYAMRVRYPLQDPNGNRVVEFQATFDTLGGPDRLDAELLDPDGSGTTQDDPANEAGATVAMLGDVNSDGYDDYLYGAPGDDTSFTDAGKATLVFGGQAFDDTSASTTIEFYGEAASQGLGTIVAAAGDFNGDGVADFAFSAPTPGSGNSKIWVVFGNDEWTTATSLTVYLGTDPINNCSAPRSSTDICAAVFYTAGSAEEAGASLAFTYDLDGDSDGAGELLIGAPAASPISGAGAGKVYLVLGGSTFEGDSVDLSTVEIGQVPGVVFLGEAAGDAAGTSVSQWYDDDIDRYDLIIGAPYAHSFDTDGNDLGQTGFVYAIHPLASELTFPTTDLAQVGISVSGVVFLGTTAGGEIGRSVTGGVDLDGDGTPDVLFSAKGEVFVISGDGPKGTTGNSSVDRTLDLAGTSGGTTMRQLGGNSIYEDFRVTRFYSATPSNPLVVSGVGDVNGDGFDDFVIGDFMFTAEEGQAYVVYGRPAWWPEEVLIDDIGVTVPGLRLWIEHNNKSTRAAGDRIGESVGGGGDFDGDGQLDAGDVNGDGLPDVIVGAPGSNQSVHIFTPLPPEPIDDVAMTSKVDFVWTRPARATDYNAYKGDLLTLRGQSSVTTSTMFPPSIVLGDCDVTSASYNDLMAPSSGNGFYYLFTAENLRGEGPLLSSPGSPVRRNDEQCHY